MECPRKVIILKKNKANSYQMVNVKVIDANANPEIIGTSIGAVNAMTSCGEEMKMVMREILGLSPDSPDWDKELKRFWNDVCEYVYGIGKNLEIGFSYDISNPSKQIYIKGDSDKKIVGLPKSITTDELLAEYCEKKIREPKSNFYKEMWKYATPLNTEDYLLYRYCQGYRDVANEHNNVNTQSHIRFYIFDEEIANAVVVNDAKIKREVTTTLSGLYGKPDELLDVLYAFGSPSVDQDETQQYIAIDKIATDTPVEFLATAKDKNLQNKAMILKYVKAGLLTKEPLTNHILDSASRDSLGKDIDETLLWFKTSTNGGAVEEYAKRFKEMKTKK